MDIAQQLSSQSSLITLKCGKETGWIVDEAVRTIRSQKDEIEKLRGEVTSLQTQLFEEHWPNPTDE